MLNILVLSTLFGKVIRSIVKLLLAGQIALKKLVATLPMQQDSFSFLFGQKVLKHHFNITYVAYEIQLHPFWLENCKKNYCKITHVVHGIKLLPFWLENCKKTYCKITQVAHGIKLFPFWLEMCKKLNAKSPLQYMASSSFHFGWKSVKKVMQNYPCRTWNHAPSIFIGKV